MASAQLSDRIVDAAANVTDALTLAVEVGDRIRVWECLRDVAEFFASGRLEDAAALFSAGEELRRVRDPYLMPMDHRSYSTIEHNLAGLEPDRRRQAELRGAALTLEAAVALAHSILAEIVEPPVGHQSAKPSLSRREGELVALVAEGLTDQQISERLFISIRTVRSHLDRIRDKTGCRRRAELTRLAATLGLA